MPAKVIGYLDASWKPAGSDEWIANLLKAEIPVAAEGRCRHTETICPGCAKSWLIDWVVDFGSQGQLTSLVPSDVLSHNEEALGLYRLTGM